MARISTYNLDEKVTGGDKWIGTDSGFYNKTKNFTPLKLADYFNSSEKIDSANSLRFWYQTLDFQENRSFGTISFENEIGASVPLSSITSFLLSKRTEGNIFVYDFLNSIEDSKILLHQGNTINIYGIYEVTNIEEYSLDSNFIKVDVSFIRGNGSLVEDLSYLLSIVDFALEDSLNWGNINGNISDQTDLQEALDLKADISDLGDVAFSNDYNDLDNLPTIPNNLEELHNVTETNYTTPIDTDSVLTFDVNNSLWKRLSWANIKSNLKTYFDTIYQTALGFTPENVANKSTDVNLGTSDTLYPTQNAVKTYIDGKALRTMYLFFPISQNVAASNNWFALPVTGQIFTGTGYADAGASVVTTNDFASLSYLTPRLFVPFQHRVKSVEVHGSTNTNVSNPVEFAISTSFVNIPNSGALTIPNPLIIARENVVIWIGGLGNGFQKKFSNSNILTNTLPSGTDYRLLFRNANQASNLQRTMLIVEVEEVL